MFGIILGTLCLIALIGTIRRERYFRRHGNHGCGYGCGGYGYHPHHPGAGAPPPHGGPGAAPDQGPSPETNPSQGATP